MIIPEKLKLLLQSRKFWVLIAALASIAATLASGAIDGWQALQAAIAALAVYSTGIAIVDAGVAAGKK
jgi:hypothetical protein